MAKTIRTTTKNKKTEKPSRSLGSRIKSIRLVKRNPSVQRSNKKLTGAFRLFMDSASLFRQHWKLFVGISMIYILLNAILAGGLSGCQDFAELKDTFTEEFGQMSANIALFGILLGSAGSSSSEGGAVYQSLIIIIISLAAIWSLRQVLAGEKFKIRDTFYKGMYPLVPFMLVLIFLGIILIPAMLGSFLYEAIFGGGVAVIWWEFVVWGSLVVTLLFTSLYFITSYMFALYIVTLPNMAPVAAIRSAKKLSSGRRWSILRKLTFLPLVFVVLGAAVLLPLISFAPGLVQYVFAALSAFGLIFAHIYFYSLYKELL